jgi:hypothetical protein
LPGNEPRLPSERRHEVNAALFAPGTKDNLSAIRRKRRLTVISIGMGQPNRLAAAYLLDPDIQMAVTTSIQSVRQKRSVTGDSRFCSEAGIGCDPLQRAACGIPFSTMGANKSHNSKDANCDET